MKRIISTMVVSTVIFWAGLAHAFDSGSTGALGAFNPSVNTEVTLPPDGKLNYTTVNIPSGVTVTFKNLSSYNSPVYMLASGDVIIGGTINMNGSNATTTIPGTGGAGGFDGGYAGGPTVTGGNGLGSGGGNPGKFSGSSSAGSGGGGGFGTDGIGGIWGGSNAGAGGTGYGNATLLPLIGGSGGGGGSGNASSIGTPGGGGGGAILIASSTSITVTGSITANGGEPYHNGYLPQGGGGSGGAIKLVADVVSGNGTITANGGYGTGQGGNGGNGGMGRIRIEADYNNRTASTSPAYTFGAPTSVFLANMPTLNIDTIAGSATPADPTGNYNQPDMVLPSSTLNPVTIAVSATDVPLPANVDVWVIPQYGDAVSYQATLSGSDQSSSGSAAVTLSTTYSNVIMAETTFSVQQAMYFDGEKIEKVRVAATAGGKSKTVYITETGKEISGELLAGLARMQ